MKSFLEEQEIIDQMMSELSLEKVENTVEYFSHLYRYTGSLDGEMAVAYLIQQMETDGINYKTYEYDAYSSIPLNAKIQVIQPEQLEISALADVFSAEVLQLEGELFYDYKNLLINSTLENEEEKQSNFRGKIVLSHEGGEMAHKAYEAGAIAFIHINSTDGNVIHHRGTGTVWGNPDLEHINNYIKIPSVGIGKEDGYKLIQMSEQKEEKIRLKYSVCMDTGIKKSTMPIAEIKGKSEKYILLSAHYDSWYEGVTDNATSNAILLELARLFTKYQPFLERSVKIAWWSGHSDGRYAGFTWYCDNKWQDLRKNCMAHINLDLTGCKGASQIIPRTTAMEGINFTADVIEKITGQRPQNYIPMIRGADQSFWGVNIPIVIMLKYEPKIEERKASCPGGGPWWHTNQDTIDKLDSKYLERDAKINGILAAQLAFGNALPIELSGFLDEMREILKKIEEKLSPEFDLTPVYRQLSALKNEVGAFEPELKKYKLECDEIIKETAGELVRITYSCTSCYEHDLAVTEKPFPGIQKTANIYSGNVSNLMFLAAKTTFIRQRNRLVGQIEQVRTVVRLQMKKWKGNENE